MLHGTCGLTTLGITCGRSHNGVGIPGRPPYVVGPSWVSRMKKSPLKADIDRYMSMYSMRARLLYAPLANGVIRVIGHFHAVVISSRRYCICYK